MLFQREKKELWRYASTNHAAVAGGMTSHQPQLQHRPQPQRHPQQNCHNSHQCQQQPPHPYHSHQQSTQSFNNCCGNMSNLSSTQLHNTPPPPYSSVPYGIDCSGASATQSSFQQPPSKYATDVETETSMSATESDTGCDRMRHDFQQQLDDFSKSGYNYGNYGDGMLVDECEQSNDSNNCNQRNFQLAPKLQKQAQESPSPRRRQTTTATTTAAVTTTTATFASTAANMFRNCCGGGFFTESSTGASTNNNNNNHNSSSSNSKNCYEQRIIASTTTARSPNTVPTLRQYFHALMKQLKVSQITTLLKAVKSRCEAPSTSMSSVPRGSAAHQPHCILIPRSPILDEEPHVIACHLFFWPDLKYASELKRLPICPNERDPVYVCCNPLHWCRILETETAPPPYQRPKMERLKYEDPALGVTSLNEGNSSTASTVSISSSSNNKMCVRIPDSLTTDGEDRRSGSLIWCQVAYWELAQRVGARYLAKKSSINIYSEGPCSGGISEGMCLKDLVGQKLTPSPDDVQYTRQKIGLGVTLSQEADGVWLYNRSTVPIFLYSPTLSESCFRVCRVMPGDCLRAFDKHRAHSLMYPSPQFPGAQAGPVDTFSIRISFAKGWGCNYKRQDITRCPCWLEVLFTQR